MKQRGKSGQFYGGLETSFGVPPSLAATHAMRHISAQFNQDPKNRVNSPEKKLGPGRYARFDRRETADGTIEGLLRPSGTLNTLPECSYALEAALGAKTNITLATTVTASPAPTVSGCTVGAVTGLIAKTTGVAITCPDGKVRVRRVTSIATLAITWSPDLPAGQAPASGAAITGLTCYYLTGPLAVSVFGARYNFQADGTAGLNEILKGHMLDRLSLSFDTENEPRFSASGPAKTRVDAPAQPGGFTQVGTNPPNALTSEAMIGNAPIKYMKVGVELTNGLALRMDEINTSAASEGYRMGDRDISIGFDMLAENSYKSALYDLALAGTNAGLFKQTGFTAGKIIAVYAPNVEWKAPTVDSGDGAVALPFKGMALEGVEDANDELVVMFA